MDEPLIKTETFVRCGPLDVSLADSTHSHSRKSMTLVPLLYELLRQVIKHQHLRRSVDIILLPGMGPRGSACWGKRAAGTISGMRVRKAVSRSAIDRCRMK